MSNNNDNNNEEERKQEFDELPFELQMKILQERKKMEALMPHVGEVVDVTLRHNDFLEEISEDTDVNDIKTKLFVEAEKLDSIKSSSGCMDLCHELAREYDYIRHVVTDLGVDAAEVAVEAVKLCIMGDFFRSAILGRAMKNQVDEYEKILAYWKKALEED